MPSPFPCSPVVGECSWKKTQVEKKKIETPEWRLPFLLPLNVFTPFSTVSIVDFELVNDCWEVLVGNFSSTLQT